MFLQAALQSSMLNCSNWCLHSILFYFNHLFGVPSVNNVNPFFGLVTGGNTINISGIGLRPWVSIIQKMGSPETVLKCFLIYSPVKIS